MSLKGLVQALRDRQKAKDTIRYTRVEAVLPKRRVVVKGQAVPLSGLALPNVGDVIPVVFRGTKPILALQHRVRRAKAGWIRTGRSILEEFIFGFLLDGTTVAQRKLWFRDRHQLTILQTVPLVNDVQWGPQSVDNLFGVHVSPLHHVYELNREVGEPFRQGEEATEKLIRTVNRAAHDETVLAPVWAPVYTGQAELAQALATINTGTGVAGVSPGLIPGSAELPPALPPDLMGTLTITPGGTILSVGVGGVVNIGPADGSHWSVTLQTREGAGPSIPANLVLMGVGLVVWCLEQPPNPLFPPFRTFVEAATGTSTRFSASAAFGGWYLDAAGRVCARYALSYASVGRAGQADPASPTGQKMIEFALNCLHAVILDLDTGGLVYTTVGGASADAAVGISYLDLATTTELDWSAVPFEIDGIWARTDFFLADFQMTPIEPGTGRVVGRWVDLIFRKQVREKAGAAEVPLSRPFISATAARVMSPDITVLIGMVGPVLSSTITQSWTRTSQGFNYLWLFYEEGPSGKRWLLSLVTGERALVASSAAALAKLGDAGLRLLDGGGLCYKSVEPEWAGGAFIDLGVPTKRLDASLPSFPPLAQEPSAVLFALDGAAAALRSEGLYHVVTTEREETVR